MSPQSHPFCSRLTHAEIERIRQQRNRSILFFVTDRCPVGCQHCSVDSRRDSPTITDFALFEEIVGWICAAPQFEIVGLSGGEPFVERRGLSLACERIAAAEKKIVIFTSGVWARGSRIPQWVEMVLSRCACVYLSTDSFHAGYVNDAHFVRAAQAVASAGAWLVIQGVNHGDAAERIRRLLFEGFGPNWQEHAEINLITPLTNGRGADVFTREAVMAGRDFGPCSLVRSPMVRYDGTVTACCNESVIRGFGPARLRRLACSSEELTEAFRHFHRDDVLRVIGDVGFSALTMHPRFSDLAGQRFTTNCELCWKVMARLAGDKKPDRLVAAMAALETEVCA